MASTIVCPECGVTVPTGRAAYKHALQEFSLSDRGPDQIIRDMRRHDNPDFAARVTALMEAALKGDGGRIGEGG